MKLNFKDMPKSRKYRYKGTIYASILEVRYVIFLDFLNVRFEYEKHGVSYRWKGLLRKYVPDFYLPDSDLYIEVKGKYPTEQEIMKANALTGLAGRTVVICSGMPRLDCISMVLNRVDHRRELRVWTQGNETLRWYLDCTSSSRYNKLEVLNLLTKDANCHLPMIEKAYEQARIFNPDEHTVK